MARSRRPGAAYGSAAWRERIGAGLRAYHERRRVAERIMPADVLALGRPGASVRPEVRRFLVAAEQELGELTAAVGGEHATPQRILLAQDCARLSTLIGALFTRWAQTQDEETATRLGTLIGARRAQLRELGLERFAKPVPDLATYLAEKARAAERETAQDGAGRDNGAVPDHEVEHCDDRAAVAPLEREAREEEEEIEP